MYVGHYYDAISIMILNQRFLSTNWFASVLISSDFKRVCKKKLVLNVSLYPPVKNSFEVGSGYTSDVGLRAKISWKNRRLMLRS